MNHNEEAISRVTVKIFGQEYTIKGLESEEYIETIANCVDQKMQEISLKSPNLPPIKIAVLVALNMVDEFHKLKKEYDLLLQLIEEAKNN